MEIKIGDPKDHLPPTKWYPLFIATISTTKHVAVAIPYNLFNKISKLTKEKGEFITTQFYLDQGPITRIFIGFSMNELDENYVLDISEDTSIIPVLLHEKELIFISDHKFKLGKEYSEEVISLTVDKIIHNLVEFNALKKSLDIIKPDNRIKNRKIIWCTNCNTKTLFDSMKLSCFRCGKENLNYDGDGNFVLS